MRLQILPLLLLSALVAPNAAAADGPDLFAMDVVFALNAKGMCRGVDVVVGDLVSAAHRRNVDPSVIEQVRDMVLSTGKTIPQHITRAINVAGKMIALDSDGGARPEKWCAAMVPRLKRDGLIRPFKH